MKKILLSLCAGAVACSAIAQWNTNLVTNISSAGFNYTTNVGTHISANGYSYNTRVGTNLAGGYAWNTAPLNSGRYVWGPQWIIYTFGQGSPTNVMQAYASPSSISNNYAFGGPVITFTNAGGFCTVRDTYVCRWMSNGIPFFIMTGTFQKVANSTNFLPGPVVATSLDGWNWTQLGWLNLFTNNVCGTNLGYLWSPKISVNATNGLTATIGIGPVYQPNGSLATGPTNAFAYDVTSTNIFQWTNPRWLNLRTLASSTEPSCGMFVFTNGLVYYFDSMGSEYTNTAVVQNGWNNPTDTLGNKTAQGRDFRLAGPSILYQNGTYYWFQTDGGYCNYLVSQDLTNWLPDIFDSDPSQPTPLPATAAGSTDPLPTEEGTVLNSTNLYPRF